MANLHYTIFWMAVMVFLITSLLLAYSLIHFRRKSDGQAKPDQSFQSNVLLETIWTLIPVGILVVLLVLTFQTMQGAGSK